MALKRRLAASSGWLLDMAPGRARLSHLGKCTRRVLRGAGAAAPLPVVAAVAPEASAMWVGAGDGRVFALGPQGLGPAQQLEGRISDVACQGQHLLAAHLQASGLELRQRHLDQEGWRPVALPRAVPMEPLPDFPAAPADPLAAAFALLMPNRFGTVLVDQARGLLAVVRPGERAVEFALQVPPGGPDEVWSAQATAQGVLLAIAGAQGRSALAHASPQGKLLGARTRLASALLWRVHGLLLLDGETALVFGEELLVLDVPTLTLLERMTHVVDTFAATALDGDVGWVGAEGVDSVLRLHREGEAVKLEGESKLRAHDGAPLWEHAPARPTLEFADGEAEVSVSAPLVQPWRRAFKNVGTPAAAVRVRITSPLLGARLLDISKVRCGGVPTTLRMNGAGELGGELEVGCPTGAALELAFELKGKGEATGEVSVSLEPVARHGASFEALGQPARTMFKLTLD